MINKKIVIITSATLFVVGILSLALFLCFFPPKLSNTVPTINGKDIKLDTKITITFNKSLSNKCLETFSITPENSKIILGGEKIIKGNSIIFTPDTETGLTPDTTYVINIIPYNIAGHAGKNFSYSFRTESVDFNLLPKKQQQLIIGGQDAIESGKDINSKLDILLPFENEYFYMVWISTTSSENDYSVLLKGDQDYSRQKAIEWIKQAGYDPNKLDIIYGTLN